MRPIYEVEVGRVYSSINGYTFLVTGRSNYGFNCSVPMIEYVSISATSDKPAGTKWVLEEEFFINRFREVQ